MSGTALRHVAIVAGAAPPPPGDAAAAVVDAVRAAAALAEQAFAVVPDLQAFSFVAPGVDRLLGDPASAPAALRGCVEAVALLEAAAARCGAALRLCGRGEGLPGELARHAIQAPAARGARSLLWFLRYGGRDEIARAATRILAARPGAVLSDEELDGWLDTAGVPDPDLIVLAGGEFAAPDALVWQGSYAELWHTPTPWPAFTGEELRRAIAEFGARERRFGK